MRAYAEQGWHIFSEQDQYLDHAPWVQNLPNPGAEL